ncbi:MAG: peroxide stress protein YaaA [Proteobacteria bacterium]|nr:peroxide stress protein YaaA [Pseudomonadota bacterium]
MKIILSPAKSLNENIDCTNVPQSQPIFLSDSERLGKKLKKLSALQIRKLMGVSADLADLNYNRFQNWSLPFTEQNSKAAAYLFTGAAYQSLDYSSLSEKNQKLGQSKLRILSGLYCLLKPLDLIQPYRLEMGTSFAVTPKVKNLYLFWGDKIRTALDNELQEDEHPVLINAASNEYSKASRLDKMKTKVITTVFKDTAKDGSYKVNMQFAKQSRGAMSRFIIENDIQQESDIKAFDVGGYYFSGSTGDVDSHSKTASRHCYESFVGWFSHALFVVLAGIVTYSQYFQV